MLTVVRPRRCLCKNRAVQSGIASEWRLHDDGDFGDCIAAGGGLPVLRWRGSVVSRHGQRGQFSMHFYRATPCISAVLAVVACPCVCPSVTCTHVLYRNGWRCHQTSSRPDSPFHSSCLYTFGVIKYQAWHRQREPK